MAPGAGRGDGRGRTGDSGGRDDGAGRDGGFQRGDGAARDGGAARESGGRGGEGGRGADGGRDGEGRRGSPRGTGGVQDPAEYVDGYGGGSASYYWDGDSYWVGDGGHGGHGGHGGYDRYDGYHRHHRYHDYHHHDNWSFYFRYSPYYTYSSYPWYDYWYDSGWSWYDGISLWYHDNNFGLFFRLGSGGRRYYQSQGSFYYRHPGHHRASAYFSYVGDLGYSYGYNSYVPRFGHFGWWDYYPRTTIVYESYVPTATYVERDSAPQAVDGAQIDSLVMDAEAEFALGNYDLAVSKLEEAVSLAPDSGQLHLALSLAYGALGSYDLSADAIRRGIELSGEGDPLVPDLRTLYGSDELLAQQLARIADAVRANPGDLDVRLVEAYFLLGGDRSQAAQAALDTLRARAPQDIVVQRLLDTATERVGLGLRGDEDTGYAADGSGGGLAPQSGEVAPRTRPNTGAAPPAPRANTPDSGSGGDYPPPSRDYSPPPPRWF